MGLLKNTFRIISKIGIFILQLNKANKFSSEFASSLIPIYRQKKDGIDYRIYCPNNVTRWRAKTYFTKEPETIEWIDSFKPGETLFDVGANIGLYSIYAAKKGIKAIAFEPESLNYALLNRNIYLNNVSESVVSLNIALSNTDTIDFLYIPKFDYGSALNTFGQERDWQGNAMKDKAYQQAVVSFSIDSFLQKYPDFFPTHIKIDVDGLESLIIEGARQTLTDSRLKSLLIELNEKLPEDMKLIELLESSGLKFKHKEISDVIAKGKIKNVYNYIFERNNS